MIRREGARSLRHWPQSPLQLSANDKIIRKGPYISSLPAPLRILGIEIASIWKISSKILSIFFVITRVWEIRDDEGAKELAFRNTCLNEVIIKDHVSDTILQVFFEIFFSWTQLLANWSWLLIFQIFQHCFIIVSGVNVGRTQKNKFWRSTSNFGDH